MPIQCGSIHFPIPYHLKLLVNLLPKQSREYFVLPKAVKLLAALLGNHSTALFLKASDKVGEYIGFYKLFLQRLYASQSKRRKCVTAEVMFPLNFAPAKCGRNGETVLFCAVFKPCRRSVNVVLNELFKSLTKLCITSSQFTHAWCCKKHFIPLGILRVKSPNPFGYFNGNERNWWTPLTP